MQACGSLAMRRTDLQEHSAMHFFMQPAPLLVYLAGAAHGRRACRRIAGRLVLLFCQTQGLVALISAYETFLADYKRGNVSTMYEEAVTHGSWRHIQPEDCW